MEINIEVESETENQFVKTKIQILRCSLEKNSVDSKSPEVLCLHHLSRTTNLPHFVSGSLSFERPLK